MRHRVRKGKLGLKTEHRLSVLRNLCTELFRHGRITSTDVKIKELRRFSEKIITTAKNDSVHSRRLVNTKIKLRNNEELTKEENAVYLTYFSVMLRARENRSSKPRS